jgi:hypothetical protein
LLAAERRERDKEGEGQGREQKEEEEGGRERENILLTISRKYMTAFEYTSEVAIAFGFLLAIRRLPYMFLPSIFLNHGERSTATWCYLYVSSPLPWSSFFLPLLPSCLPPSLLAIFPSYYHPSILPSFHPSIPSPSLLPSSSLLSFPLSPRPSSSLLPLVFTLFSWHAPEEILDAKIGYDFPTFKNLDEIEDQEREKEENERKN